MIKQRIPALVGILCAICLVAIGVINGQHTAVLAKAVKICLECIGIG